jgi:hypothetical protein
MALELEYAINVLRPADILARARTAAARQSGVPVAHSIDPRRRVETARRVLRLAALQKAEIADRDVRLAQQTLATVVRAARLARIELELETKFVGRAR